MKFKIINEFLQEITSKKYKILTKVAQESSDKKVCDDGLAQGDYNFSIEVFEHKETDTFLKVERRTDSYNDNEFIYSIQFVTPVIRQVTNFEKI